MLKSDLRKTVVSYNTKESSEKALGEYGHLLEIQPFEVCIFVLKDREEFRELHTLLTGSYDPSYDDAEGLCIVMDSPQFGVIHLMYLPEAYDARVVWHESLHMAHFMMEYVGIDVDGARSSSELQCYLQGHIVTLIKKDVYPEPTIEDLLKKKKKKAADKKKAAPKKKSKKK